MKHKLKATISFSHCENLKSSISYEYFVNYDEQDTIFVSNLEWRKAMNCFGEWWVDSGLYSIYDVKPWHSINQEINIKIEPVKE